MRVCVDARVSTRGGTSTFIENYLRELDGFDHAHEIEFLWSADRAILGNRDTRGTAVPVRNRILEFQWSQWQLPRLLNRHRVELYHSLKHVGPLRCGARTLYRVPAVGQFSDNYPMPYPDHVYWKYLGGFVYRRADLLIAVSDYIRRGLIEHLGLPEERIVVIHNGVDPRFRRLKNPDAKQWETLGITPPFILCVGNLLPVKNFATAITAYSRLRGRSRDAPPLVLAGGQQHPHHKTLRTLVHDLGIDDHVHFLGFQSTEDLVALYNGAAILLHPSFHEGFSFTILEAMACGVPVVASATTSIPEAAGDAALYTDDPRDAEAFAAHLEALLWDGELAATLSRNASERIGQFTWQRCVRDTVALYDRMA